jgi:hypothetical protein
MSIAFSRPNILSGRADWKPFVGQTQPSGIVTRQAPPADGKMDQVAAYAAWAGLSAAAGAVVGIAINMITPSTRIPRKEAWKIAGASAGISALGMTLGTIFGENRFYNALVGVGGVLAGNAVADVIVPAPKTILDILPSVG